MNLDEQQEEILNRVQQENTLNNRFAKYYNVRSTIKNVPAADLVNFVKKEPYFFSNSIAGVIIGLLIIAFTFWVIYSFCKDKSLVNEGKDAIMAIPFIFGIIQFLAISFIYLNIKSIINSKCFKSALDEGQSTPGKIVGYCSEHFAESNDNYYLAVEYMDFETDEKKLLITPCLTFDPFVNMGSTNCNVYKYKNKVYAYDFESKYDTNQIADIREQNEYLKIQTLQSKREFISISLITLLFLIVDIVYVYLSFYKFW